MGQLAGMDFFKAGGAEGLGCEPRAAHWAQRVAVFWLGSEREVMRPA